MARWKLATAHYLNIPGTEWEYTETDRTTGQQKRKRIPVPKYLDPNIETDWNASWGNRDNRDGEIHVCHAGKGEPKDYVFVGDPTPDMIPLDDEAQAISDTFKEQWRYKPEDPASGGYSQSMVDKIQFEMAELKAKPATVPGLEDLARSLGELVQQNRELMQPKSGFRIGGSNAQQNTETG